MRQFILARGGVISNVQTFEGATDGQIAVTYLKTGEDGTQTLTKSTTGKEFKIGNIILFHPDEKNGNIVIPVHTNNFSYVKGVYQAPEVPTKQIEVGADGDLAMQGDYTIILAKIGAVWNERNKWTFGVHVTARDVLKEKTIKEIKEELVKKINSVNYAQKLPTAIIAGDYIQFKSDVKDDLFNVIGADELMGAEVKELGERKIAYGDADYVRDLAQKAMADAGAEYTYRDAYTYLYPTYFSTDEFAAIGTDTKFTIFTLRFAEPRNVKTRDDVVNQIVQIALPEGDEAISTLETIFKGMAGEETPTGN